MALILINTLFLALESYNMSPLTKEILHIGNIVFTILFTIEMCFKLFGFGIKGYLSDNYNIFDAIIVLISLAELFLLDSDNKEGGYGF